MTNKMTLKEMYAEIINFANGAECSVTPTEIVEFCNGRLEQLAKKGSSKSKKVNEEQVALMGTVLECLATETEPVTVSQLMANHEEISPTVYSNQKISAMLKKLVENGTVNKTVNKGKTYFMAV